MQGNVLREIFHVKKCSTPKKKKQIAPTTLEFAPHQVSAFIFGGQKKPAFSVTFNTRGPSINHRTRDTFGSPVRTTLRIRYFFSTKRDPSFETEGLQKKKVTAVIKLAVVVVLHQPI